MKIALANTDFPQQDLQTAATLAIRCGVDAVELSDASALLTPPEIVRQIFTSAGVRISALQLVGPDLRQLPLRIRLAAELNAPFVRLSGNSLFARTGVATAHLIDQLLTAAEFAAENGVAILINNEPVKDSAVRLWRLLDRLNHPSIGCCWNTFSAAQAGDAPSVAVPMLNTRIRYVHLQDAKSNIPCELGQGDLPLRNTLNRLRGIGYDGYLLLGSTAYSCTDPTSIEQWLLDSLTAARTVLQQWQVLPMPKPG